MKKRVAAVAALSLALVSGCGGNRVSHDRVVAVGNGYGAAEVDAERTDLRGDLVQVGLDVGEVGHVHLVRRQQRDVGRDVPRGLVAGVDAVLLQLAPPGLGDGDGDTDGGHQMTLPSQSGSGAGGADRHLGTNPTRS